MGIFDDEYLGHTVAEYATALGIAVGVLAAVWLTKWVVTRRLRALTARTETRLDDLGVVIVGRTSFAVAVAVAVYAGSLALALRTELADALRSATVIALVLQLGMWVSGASGFLLADYRNRKKAEGDTASLSAVAVLGAFGRIALWIVILLLVLDNVGVNVTALVAGLGIGGIAIALAVRDILADIFASVSIMLDKPFEVGDAIAVGDLNGKVERVGIKTTRLRAPSGEQLVFPNDDLLGSRIKNYKRMEERRALFVVSVTYQTPVDKVELIPAMIREVIESQDQVRLDRVHFKSLGDSALLFEAVYYMAVPDYALYMDTQQRINLAILRVFEGAGIELAYPTQTVHVSKAA